MTAAHKARQRIPVAGMTNADLVAVRVTRADAIVGSVQLRIIAQSCPSPEAAALLERIAVALTIGGAS